MFERFTERARQVVVLAQDEARALRHNYIGTEHILLGLLREEEGLAARALESLGITVDEVRAQVARIVGQGDELTTGQIPFTPRAKRVLEHSLREALAMGHNHIGTEHVLLGVVREDGGVAARILLDLDVTPRDIAGAVVASLSGHEPHAAYVTSFSDEAGGSPVGGHFTTYDSPEVWPLMRARPWAFVVLGWALFGVALALGILVGWLIWR